MDIMERINILRDTEFSTEQEYKDLVSIVALFQEEFNISLTEENAGVMITHMAAAFRRNRTKESIDGLDPVVVEQMEASGEYSGAVEILREIQNTIENKVNAIEEEYFLLHISNFLEAM